MVQQHAELLRGFIIKAVIHSAVRAAHAPQTGSHFLDTSGATTAQQEAPQARNIPECYSGAQIPSAGTSVVTNTPK